MPMRIENETLEPIKTKITVVIPALNEEEGIGATLQEISQETEIKNIVVVDGGSLDGTPLIALENGAKVVYERNAGKGDAIVKGLESLTEDSKYIVIIDADYTYPASYIPIMIKILENNPRVGMVIGNRFSGTKNEKPAFSLGNQLLVLSHKVFNGISLADPLSGLRVIRSEILKNWKPVSKGFDIEVELNAHTSKRGYEIVEIPITYRKRIGENKLKISNFNEILRRIFLEH
jgi:dolichol-phosphate hexosyltransferase